MHTPLLFQAWCWHRGPHVGSADPCPGSSREGPHGRGRPSHGSLSRVSALAGQSRRRGTAKRQQWGKCGQGKVRTRCGGAGTPQRGQATTHPDLAPPQFRVLASPTTSRQPPRSLQSPSTPSDHQSLHPDPLSKLSSAPTPPPVPSHHSHLLPTLCSASSPASPPPASFLLAWVSGQGWSLSGPSSPERPFTALVPGVSRRLGGPAMQPTVRPGPRTRGHRPARPTSADTPAAHLDMVCPAGVCSTSSPACRRTSMTVLFPRK